MTTLSTTPQEGCLTKPNPVLFLSSIDYPKEYRQWLMAKTLASSLCRSLYTGEIHLARNKQDPFFKIERKNVEEHFVHVVAGNMAEGVPKEQPAWLGVEKFTTVASDQWVIFANAAGISLRNIDHLFDSTNHHLENVDLLYTARDDGALSSGFWAVRGEHLALVLSRWRERMNGNEVGINTCKMWDETVESLSLKCRPFEKGEVVSPTLHKIDWDAVMNASFVTVPEWPTDNAHTFLQSLYLGRYLGDETGMIINLLNS